MAVGITVGQITDEIGAPDFVHAFFSTISAHCEPNGWGTRFPMLIQHLYQGSLSYLQAPGALDELAAAKRELSFLSPSQVVWNIEHPNHRPPWSDDIASTITSLENYFVSSTGRDVFDLIREALEASVLEQQDAVLG